ncbi:MAG TPA: amidohydrolase family protein [Chitinophagaceae bacterium]|jgi:L-fuconolactonase|nr:amidohydrolase family protein [Chitinophagaceae bacterium]
MRIDAHQHFWKFDPIRDSWITDEMAVIQKDFLPQDLKPILDQNGFDGCVTIQSDQSYDENRFQLHNAAECDFIKGIVGWADLTSPNVEKSLDYLSQFEKMKGFRHVLQGEKDRAFMLQPAFMNGISKLEKFGFTYDILIFPDQLKYIAGFVEAFTNQKFVIDHIAKPEIKNGKIEEWKKEMMKIGEYENVYCKISGMVTEADWKNWKKEDFVPYIDVVVNAFGIKRIMYGSDWPVCLVAASYEKMLNIARDYFSSFSQDEQQLVFGENATKFYSLGQG